MYTGYFIRFTSLTEFHELPLFILRITLKIWTVSLLRAKRFEGRENLTFGVF